MLSHCDLDEISFGVITGTKPDRSKFKTKSGEEN